MGTPIKVITLLKEKWELEREWNKSEESTRRIQAIENALKLYSSLQLFLEMNIPNPE